MNQRITRAKSKIRHAGIPYKVPENPDIVERLAPVLSVIYLIYNESYTAFEGEDLTRTDLAIEAIRLAEIFHSLLPHPEVAGLLALMILHNARRAARTDEDANIVSLQAQNRGLWDATAIAKGKKLLLHALSAKRPGPFQIQAAISALHSEAPNWEATDWPQITGLYNALYDLNPSPVVALNQAAAMGNTGAIKQALDTVQTLAEDLAKYQPFYATRADLLSHVNLTEASIKDYRTAIGLSNNDAEKAFLARKMQELT